MKFTYESPDGTETVFSRDAENYKLLKRYSGLAEIPVAFSSDRSPYQHGETLLDTLMEPRDVSFDILIQIPSTYTTESSVFDNAIFDLMVFDADDISNLELLQAQIATLSLALNPLEGPGHLYYERDDGTIYRLNCSPNNSPVLDTSNRSDLHQKATLDFRAHDPFWYSGVPYVHSFITTIANFFPWNIPWVIGTTTSRKTVVNAGNIEAPVIISIWGPITDPVITNETSGKTIALDLELLEGDRFDITTGKNNNTALYTPVSTGIPVNGFPYITVASKFWTLLKGSNSILFSCSTSTDGSGASLTWSDQFAGVF